MKFCPQCGTTFEPEARFCLECGFDRTTVEPVNSTISATPQVIITETEQATEVPAEPALPDQKAESACPKCNSILIPGDRFCQECGFDMTTISRTETITPKQPQPAESDEKFITQDAVQEVVHPAEAKQFCPQCGTVVASGERFCLNCGLDTKTDQINESTGHIPLAQPAMIPKTELTEDSQKKASAPIQPAQQVKNQEPVKEPPLSSLNSDHVKTGKSKLWIVWAVLGIVILGAAGWLVYNEYFKTTEAIPAEAAVTPLEAENPAIDTGDVETQTPQITEPTLPEQPKVNTKKLSRVDQELAKHKTKQSNTPEQSTPTKPQQAQPDVNVKISPVAKSNNIKTEIILEVGKKEDAKNKKPKNPTKLTLEEPTMIVRITTDHYNDGMGTPGGGTITIKDQGGTIIGSFKATGKSGNNGTPNAKWVAEPNKMLDKGIYYIWDSDMSTWSKNLLGNGFVVVEGYEVK